MSVTARGDTIVEVILGFAIFTLVAVGAMVVMNQGSNAAQRALEITMVRQQVNAQAEALRAAQQAYAASDSRSNTEWEKIIGSGGSLNDSTVFGQIDNDTVKCPDDISDDIDNTFIMDPRDGSFVNGSTWLSDINNDPNAPPYARVIASGTDPVKSYGIWIERKFRSGDAGALPDSYDFTVRACWYGAGLNIPLQIETSVRLYAPGT